MRSAKIPFCRGRLARGFTALALFCSFLVSVALATAPVLHARWHPDAGQPNHQCAATTLAQQHVGPAALPELFRTDFAVSFRFCPRRLGAAHNPVVVGLPPERGPPGALARPS